jgi:ubiquinone/menaquinone biosynthesis C-methylase UbiE
MRKFENFKKIAGASLIICLVLFNQCMAQNLDVPYVPTPETVVESMLNVAKVGPGDYVIDLGSGDGRIVIAAANRGAIGHGVDLNPVRVREAKANASKAGVSDKVSFYEGNIFQTDISKATVITMYLLHSVNLELRPRLLNELKPGTRVVSHSFSMDDWEADEHVRVDNRNVYFWVIPAKIDGTWQWSSNGKDFTMKVSQRFQKISLDVSLENKNLRVSNPVLHGDRISFAASDPTNGNQYVFSGRVENNKISGTTEFKDFQSRVSDSWSARFVGK